MRRLNRPRPAWILLPLLLVFVLAEGCGSHDATKTSDSSPGPSIKKCDEYAERYESCLSWPAAEPDRKALAHERASATREAFASAARTGNRDEVEKTCVDALAQLHCP